MNPELPPLDLQLSGFPMPKTPSCLSCNPSRLSKQGQYKTVPAHIMHPTRVMNDLQPTCIERFSAEVLDEWKNRKPRCGLGSAAARRRAAERPRRLCFKAKKPLSFQPEVKLANFWHSRVASRTPVHVVRGNTSEGSRGQKSSLKFQASASRGEHKNGELALDETPHIIIADPAQV